jgi:hypothetical protein
VVVSRKFDPTSNGSNLTLNDPFSKRSNSVPAPLPVDFRNRAQTYHIEEHIEIIPVLPSQPPMKRYSASYSQNGPISPTYSPTSTSPYATVYPNQEYHVIKADPMYPENYGVPVQSLSQSYRDDDESNHVLTPALLQSYNSTMNEKVGPMVSKSRVPPSAQGFFGFWDKKGKFHQGYTDENLYIHGGVFDDQCYFYFGDLGEDAVFVDDSMMAVNNIEAPLSVVPEMPMNNLRDINEEDYAKRAYFENEDVLSSSNPQALQDFREESMDVFACSVQSPRYI